MRMIEETFFEKCLLLYLLKMFNSRHGTAQKMSQPGLSIPSIHRVKLILNGLVLKNDVSESRMRDLFFFFPSCELENENESSKRPPEIALH